MTPRGGWRRIARALRLIAEPVPAEKRRLMAERWAGLDARWRLPFQGFGLQATGCGATLGVNPRCDFDCHGCYLGVDANRARRFSRAEVERQLAALARWLGPKGNLQLTDGEVTLLPERELIALVRSARERGLIPMLMTHGDTFRRRPGLLARLVADGGLSEVCFHVDTTQRGRRGVRAPAHEADLHPVRDELAGLVREARRATGVRLRAAATMTVTRDNLDGVPAVVERYLELSDVFGVVSFQPLAPVGRTRAHLQGVTAGELWSRIGTVLGPLGLPAGRGPVRFGHPDCSRLEPAAVVRRRGRPPRLLPLARSGGPRELALAEEWLARGLGGLNFRDDPPLERACRALGALLAAPHLFAGPLRRWAGERAAETGTGLLRLAGELAAGSARLDAFTVASHHFMGADELATPRGRERLEACVFRVPAGGEMVPMCRVNATPLRDRLYGLGSSGGSRWPASASPISTPPAGKYSRQRRSTVAAVSGSHDSSAGKPGLSRASITIGGS